MEDSIICPFCSLNFDTARKFKNHVAKIQDTYHHVLLHFYTHNKLKCDDLIPFYNKYKDFFQGDNEEIIINNINESVNKTKVLGKSKVQYTLENYKEQLMYLQEQANIKKIQKKMLNMLNDEDKPIALLHYFYDKTEGHSYNQIVELKLLKELYTKHHLDAPKIRLVLDYLIFMGYDNILKINYFINDALLFDQYTHDINVKNSSAYFVRQYYRGLKQKCVKTNFVKEVRLIEATRTGNNLTDTEVENIINGMVKDKVKTLMWFANCVIKYKDVTTFAQSNAIVHEYSQDREVSNLVKEIIDGNMSLEQVTDRLQQPCVSLLTQKFINGDFDNRYNHFEFAYKIKLNLTKDLYELAKQSKRSSRFEYLYANVNDEDKRKKITQQFNQFQSWLATQPQ